MDRAGRSGLVSRRRERRDHRARRPLRGTHRARRLQGRPAGGLLQPLRDPRRRRGRGAAVREAVLWVSGAALAFLATAGAFLLLANLGTGPSVKSLPPESQPAHSGPALELNLDEGELASLQPLPDQR